MSRRTSRAETPILLALLSSCTLWAGIVRQPSFNGSPHLDDLIASFDALPDKEAVPAFRSSLHQFLQAIVADEKSGQAMSIIFHIVEITSQETELQTFLRALREKRVEGMSKACLHLYECGSLREGLKPDLIAKGIASYLLGLVNQYFSPHPFADLKAEGADLLDLYLDAVLIENKLVDTAE